MSELKRLNQRQDAFLRHLKCTNHPGYEAQSCSTQKVGFSKWRLFFDLMHFKVASVFLFDHLDHCLCHLVDFKGERDPLQQNGLQGQYQYGFIVSKTCCNFLVEFVSSFFHLK